MTQSRLRYVLGLVIWLICAAGFCASVFFDGGPAAYDDGSPRRVVGGAFLAFGLLGSPLMRLLTRGKTGRGSVQKDERDERIDAKATRIGMIIVVTVVFFGCIFLSDAYQEADSVPVAWMWVMAYSTLILSQLAPVVIALALDLGVLKSAP